MHFLKQLTAWPAMLPAPMANSGRAVGAQCPVGMHQPQPLVPAFRLNSMTPLHAQSIICERLCSLTVHACMHGFQTPVTVLVLIPEHSPAFSTQLN